ncbi:hypothetical protein RND71_014731 [Anisodus tanguticus]|uniref:Uncharacterized protein n=1 Tax=Anisodus tanguticus TaxID=243964 RepID=A0AAE1VK51_9SOLA|nr:hypothetical protein RND71_014731 [Anisodus tanguticus]
MVSVRCANELMVPSWFIEKEYVSLPLLECKWLTINSLISKYCFLGKDRLLSLLVSKIQLFVVYPASPPPPSHASHSDASPGSRAPVNPTAGTEISTSSNVSATGFSTASTGIVINPVLVLAAALMFLQRSEEACWMRVKDRQEEGQVRVTNSVT